MKKIFFLSALCFLLFIPLLPAADLTYASPAPQTGDSALTIANKNAVNIGNTRIVIGEKADAKSTATDTTAITIMQVLKQMSASLQAIDSGEATNAGITGVSTKTLTDLNVQLTALNTVIGTTADADSADTMIGLLKAIKANTAAP